MDKAICASPQYKHRLRELQSSAKLSRFSAPERLRRHKLLLRQAGLEARNLILATDANGILAQKLVVCTIARIVAENNTQLFEKPAPISEVVRKHLGVVDGQMSLLDAADFALLHDSALLRATNDELRAVNDSNARPGVRSRSTAPLEKPSNVGHHLTRQSSWRR